MSLDTIIPFVAENRENIVLQNLYADVCYKLKNMTKECTMQLSQKYLKRDRYLKLEYLYKMLFNHDPKQDHRAFNDAIMCKEVYYGLKEIYKNKNKAKDYALLYNFKSCFRYIDDLLSLNNNNHFNTYKEEIFS